MSDHHSNCTNHATGAHRRCDCGEDGCDNDKLWNDFESCARSVAVLFNETSWRNFSGAAAGATQLYKTSVDSYRKGFDKGFQAGRSALAKEVLSAFSQTSKFDINLILEVIYRNMRTSSDESGNTNQQYTISPQTLEAMQLFQQALTQPQQVASVQSSPQREQRNPDLTTFLASQVQRHRKRLRSPTSPGSQNKRQRKT